MGHIISQAKAAPTSTAVTAGKALPSAALAGSATATGVAFKNANSEAIFLPLPGPNHLTNRRFTIKAWGRVTIGATNRDFTAGLYYGISNATRTVVSAAVIGEVPASTTVPWQIEATLVWDSTAGKLQGSICGNVGAVFVADVAVTAVLADVDFDGTIADANSVAASAVKGFIMTGLTEATITASDVSYLDGFHMEID
jgi:hypothetical protein